jgi:ATP-dependent RNA helicase DHX29
MGSVVSSANIIPQLGGRQEMAKTGKAMTVDYDSDIDPDELVPKYLEYKEKLFRLQSSSQKEVSRQGGKKTDKTPLSKQTTVDPESFKLIKKIKKIEEDVLFDRFIAEQQWASRRITLERDAAAQRSAFEQQDTDSQEELATLVDSDDEISREAAKIGAELLEEDSDDDATLADLFASLPVNEVDPITGKSTTVINGTNGSKVIVRDFGKWTGVSPVRVLEEACRARLVVRSHGY